MNRAPPPFALLPFALLPFGLVMLTAAGPPNSFLTISPAPSFSTTDTKPAQKPGAATPDGYTAAPTPNQDVVPPTPPKASSEASLSPGFFTRKDQTRGDGYLPSSSIQAEQQSRAKPGAGINLSLPLQ